ncbi:uncharacterized protein AC631_01014 [Debaryomyces fabryi]|uniref:Transcriptional regulatory protein DEP1 n=1 Tax=Debaryomyces fabryi TaxID=58627 RepID=A0A0V1Q424_9ASCO|nr:uncharacterized protein AC631_01014 [Debaryomyces fabryi]KSA03240.1 hypothetical protein AC631_01014 [Debaryomyces fabryi]CUM55258.1 unnamed protein product [Debaryomyces fabryi]
MATEESNNKESPLTDIATSPPPFDLTLNNKESEDDETSNFVSNNGNSGQESQENNSTTNRDSYESSELSDLGEDESEAETDKMDFLDDDPNTSGEKVLDLNAISKLTELAHLKEVDSDNEDDENELKTEEKEVEEDDKEALEMNNEDTGKTDPKIEESSSDGEMSINPKENAEANKEIMEDLERISQSVEDGTSRRASKRSLSDSEKTNNKKPKIESEEETSTGKSDEKIPDNVQDNEGDNSDVEESQKDDFNNGNSNSGEDDDNEDANNGEKTDDQEADEEDADDIGDSESNENVDMNEKRKLAIEELISIESSFAELRDKLYQDKLNLLENELQLCLEGSHPELSRIYYKINQFHQDSLKQANSNLNYKLKCIDISTIASRTSIHQNFLKKLMDCKNDMITDTTSLWYKINKERNQLDQIVPDYNFTAIPLIPNYTAVAPIEETAIGVANSVPNGHEIAPLSKKAIKQNTVFELVEQRNNLNCQLGILNGLLQFHGFPSALYSNTGDNDVGPSQELLLRKATDEEINDDLRAMGIPM